MTEELTTLIVSLAPSLGALITVIVGVVKLIKSFDLTAAKQKKEIEKQREELGVLLKSQSALIEENGELRKEIAALTDKVEKSLEINDKVDKMINEMEEVKTDLTNTVNDSLRAGMSGVEQIKRDKKAIGE